MADKLIDSIPEIEEVDVHEIPKGKHDPDKQGLFPGTPEQEVSKEIIPVENLLGREFEAEQDKELTPTEVLIQPVTEEKKTDFHEIPTGEIDVITGRRLLGNAPQRQIVSYDYFDIAKGTGVEVFHGFANALSGAVTYHLTSEPVNANFYVTKGVAPNEPTGAYTKFTTGGTTFTYDTLAFNVSRTLNGEVFLSIPVALDLTSTDSGDVLVRDIKLSIVHVDTSTTDITTTIGTDYVNYGEDNALANWYFTLTTPNISNQIVKKGEKIRLTIIYELESETNADGYALHNGGGGSISFEEGDAPNTDLQVHLPFKLDLD